MNPMKNLEGRKSSGKTAYTCTFFHTEAIELPINQNGEVDGFM